MNNNLLDFALSYANKGWYVFPCREKPSEPFLNKQGKEKILREKTPYTKNGLNDATTEEKGRTSECHDWGKLWII
jgi:putative DNA primase/helicase